MTDQNDRPSERTTAASATPPHPRHRPRPEHATRPDTTTTHHTRDETR